MSKLKVLLIIGLFLFLVLIFLGVFVRLPQEKKGPSVEPPLLFTSQGEVAKSFPSYTGVKINATRETEVDTLPNRKEKKLLPDGSTQHSFPSTDLSKDNLVITKNDVAVFKSAVTVLPQSLEHPKVSSYVNSYGNPEGEFTGSQTYGRFAKTYVYASKGFALIFNPFTDEVFEIQAFLPVSLDEYLSSWGTDIKEFTDEPHGDEPL